MYQRHRSSLESSHEFDIDLLIWHCERISNNIELFLWVNPSKCLRLWRSEESAQVSRCHPYIVLQLQFGSYPTGGVLPLSTRLSRMTLSFSSSRMMWSMRPIIRFTLFVRRLLALDSSTVFSWPLLKSSIFISSRSWRTHDENTHERQNFNTTSPATARGKIRMKGALHVWGNK